MEKPLVLMVDDDREFSVHLISRLEREAAEISFVSAVSEEEGLEKAASLNPDVCVVDLSIDETVGPRSGLELIRKILKVSPTARVIVLTGHTSDEYGVAALNKGAASFLHKPPNTGHLLALIRDAIEISRLRKRALRDRSNSCTLGFSTSSLDMKGVLEKAARFAKTPQAVLLVGETGVGKGVIARAIHNAGNKQGEFCRIQPGFHSHDLIVSELVGHERGAFTGAHVKRDGLIARANKGTLFLDEVDKLPEETQVFLLNILQEREFRRIGGGRVHKADFRLIAATNADVAALKVSLREDFYFRIAHATLVIPPLRERLADIPSLVQEFVANMSSRENLAVYGVSEEACVYLQGMSWPGNVRELQHAVEYAVYKASAEGKAIVGREDFEIIDEVELSLPLRLKLFEINMARQALTVSGNHYGQAAAMLGIDRKRLRRILSRTVH